MRIMSAFALLGLFSLTPVQAQETSGLLSGWEVNVGAGLRYGPRFEGSDRMTAWGVPIFSLSRAGEAPRFRAPDDGISIGIFDNGIVRAGPVLEFRSRREEADDRVALRGLGNVDFAAEPGVFADWTVSDGFRLRTELRRGFGGHEGLTGDVGADFYTSMSQPLRFSIGPRVAFASSEALKPYFGVTSAQSLASGLPVYKPSGGFRSTGLVGSVSYEPIQRVTLTAFARYDHLLGDVGNAPLVKERGSRNQASLGLGVSYRFSTAGW